MTDVAIATFNDSAFPGIGILTFVSASSYTSSLTPFPSFPTVNRTFPLRLSWKKSLSVSRDVTTILKFLAFKDLTKEQKDIFIKLISDDYSYLFQVLFNIIEDDNLVLEIIDILAGQKIQFPTRKKLYKLLEKIKIYTFVKNKNYSQDSCKLLAKQYNKRISQIKSAVDRIDYLLSNGNSEFLHIICRKLYEPIFYKMMNQVLKKEIDKSLLGKKRIKEYSVYRIDFSKVENIKLYKDPNARGFDSYFTMDNIRPEWIEKIDEIKL